MPIKQTDYIMDPFERGVETALEHVGIGQTETGEWKLTTIDGIGPATAEKLEAAGIKSTEQLARLTPSQLMAIEGIGPATAERIAAKFQWAQSRFVTGRKGQPEKAREAMAERSPTARRTDRSFNAPVTFNYEKWAANPNRYDYPGVDTVPMARRAERVKKMGGRLRERGGVEKVVPKKMVGGATGRQAGTRLEVDVGRSSDAVSTIAHELGHAADAHLGGGRGGTSTGMFDDERLMEEAETLSTRRRKYLADLDHLREHYDEQDLESELFADAFAVALEEPRAARREAPNLVRELEKHTLGKIGRF